MSDELAAAFSAQRPHLTAVAYRMLGSTTEAEDAVQETWLRLSRSDVTGVDNLGGWLTTVVSRICLDLLRARTSRREDPGGIRPEQAMEYAAAGPSPAEAAVLADEVGAALLVVLDTLEPAERLAFVLHDMFGVSFDDIAGIVGRRPAAARQLASRARRRVRQADASPAGAARRRRDEIVTAFMSATKDGDFAALLMLLDPDVELRSDAVAAVMGADALVVGADAVAANLSGRAKATRLTFIDGELGAAWYLQGEVKVVFRFTVDADRVALVELLADPATLEALDLNPVAAT